MQQKKVKISAETVAESLRLARATQVAGQSKEQTQLIAQGIQKGIAEYKRAQKTKQRAAERAKKQQRRQCQSNSAESSSELMVEMEYQNTQSRHRHHLTNWLPWILLLLTWVGIGIQWWRP